ncbi:MAG: hypothetical protein CBD57_00145 [Candidatus Pelagibacter sp. TMED197]|nr:MAG: hypothetical protein CBD57_00145 [Candidatus Pelagibacter sp. TMED197]
MKNNYSKSNINSFMTFGKMPIANGFIKPNDFDKEFFFEMKVGFDEKLSLFQLLEHPKPEMMFNENYPFFTQSSKFMIKHFEDYAKWVKERFFNKTKRIIEIGSNDGTFLQNFTKDSLEVYGFEPSKNVSDIAKTKGINSINEFFNSETIMQIDNYKNNIDIITAANVICHIPNIEELFKTIEQCLSKKGVFVFEEPYLGSMMKKVSYDQIYDEHIYIFSVSAIDKISKNYGLRLIDVLEQSTHGGSMRYVLGRDGEHTINKSVDLKLKEEKKINLDNIESCIEFKKNCETSKKNLRSKILSLKNNDKKICGYAATSKSTTILNYCNLGSDLIDYICDTTPEKIGKFSPGKHIPIKDMNYFYENPPDVAFLFAWNHKNEIFEKEKSFSKKGEWIAHVDLK